MIPLFTDTVLLSDVEKLPVTPCAPFASNDFALIFPSADNDTPDVIVPSLAL